MATEFCFFPISISPIFFVIALDVEGALLALRMAQNPSIFLTNSVTYPEWMEDVRDVDNKIRDEQEGTPGRHKNVLRVSRVNLDDSVKERCEATMI